MHEAYTGMMNCHPKYVSRNEIVEMHLFRILKTYLEEEGGELQAGLWQPQNEQPFHPQYIGGAMMLRPPQESTKMHFQSYCTKSSTTIPNGDYQQKDNLCTKIVQYNKYNVPEIDESQFNSSPTTL